MSRGPPHRYNPTGERSFRGYPPRYGEFSGSSSYGGYYGGPPYKRQRRLSEEDLGPPSVSYGPAYFDPPYARHQEVGLGEFNDFSSVSVEKDLKVHKRDGSRKDYERSESHDKKRQSSTEGSGHSTSGPSSPHSTKVSPRFSPRHSPKARPTTPPSSSTASYQPLLITTSQSFSSSKAQSLSSSDEGVSPAKQLSLQIVCTTSSQSARGPVVKDKLKDGKGRPTPMSSLLPGEGFQRKESYSGPAVEAISPSAPGLGTPVDKDSGGKKGGIDEPSDMMSKDELLQGMEKVDREIAQVKQQINNLKKVQKQLEDEASKAPEEPQKEEVPIPEPKPRSVVQKIYEENRKKAEAVQARLAKLGVPLPGGKIMVMNLRQTKMFLKPEKNLNHNIYLPLYNQPSDLACYHENLRRAPAIKAKLVKYFQLRKQAKEIKNRQLCKEYKTLKQAWLKKIERHENNPKRKHKEAKLREFYEKVFPEIKKQREQTERFTRMGSRSNWGIVARSEAEFNEIVDNLNEQEANERHMRTLAVEPPPVLDKEERRVKFINRNGLIRDPLALLNERKHRNIWTEKERRTFKDKFIHNPKDFDLIASFLPDKSVSDCILFYYQTKKKEDYKRLSRRHNLKKRRRDQFAAGRENAPINKTRVGASESSAKGERAGSEGEEDLEEMTDSAEESEENEEHTQPPVTTTQVTTPAPPARRPDHVETSRWSEKEIEIALQGLKDCGRDWEAIARRVMTKTGAQCKNFYFNYKKKLQLELLVAEHERTKMQRAQQQPKQHQPPPPSQQQPQQKDTSSIPEKNEPTPKQASEGYTPPPSNQHNVKTNSASTSNVSTSSGRESTSVVVGAANTPVGPPADVSTATTTNAVSNLQLAAPRVAPSHSPRLPLTSSSSTLFMPTPGVIASIGRASPNVATGQPGQVYFRTSLPESMKHDSPHSSRSPHPETIFPGLIYPRAVDPKLLQTDPAHLRPEFLVSSRPGHPHSESHSPYQGSSAPKLLPHSSSSLSSSSSDTHSTKGVLHLASQTITSHPGSSHTMTTHPVSHTLTSFHPGSHSMTSHPGTVHTMTSHTGPSHTGKLHSGNPYGHSSYPSDSAHAPASGRSTSALSHHSRPARHSPVIVVPQDKSQSEVSFLKEPSAGHHSSHKATYLGAYPGSVRGEPAGRSIKTDDGRTDISPERLHKPLSVPEPDVIVIDADNQKKRMESYPRMDTAEGKQASSMLRMLASAGNAPSGEQMLPSAEPMRPQSLPPSSSSRHLMSHTESRAQQSATPPGSSFAARQPALNPPPPLIQMSSARDKKYAGVQDLPKETSRPREGFMHSESFHERCVHGQEATSGRDVPRHTHTPVDNRGSERERQTPVVETVDLTRDRDVSTSPLTRPTSRSPVVALSSSSARATLQAMAMYALAETNTAGVSEKIAQKKREETYLPPRTPDPKLSVYEQSEAIRKFTALGNVCVSAAREFPAGSEYPSQPYGMMAMQAQYQPHVHPHPSGASPPPYGYPFHVGRPMASFHHHPEPRFLVPVGVHQVLPHSVNGEDLPSHLKLTGAFAHQYPQGAGYFPAGIRSVLPTYQPMTVCGHPYPVQLGDERRTMHHPLDVPVRRHNDISEQDLANPFVVKQPRHVHSPGMPERVVSPSELPKFPLPSRSPLEPGKRPHTISPEIKSQVAAHAEIAKAVSPPAGTYLSRIPSRPVSVTEMRNRAAVIPELKDTDTVSQKFPEPQRVSVPNSKHSSREDLSRLAEQSSDGDSKEQAKEDKSSSFVEDMPMSAFATLVDVAAAARKVDVPFSAREKHGSPVPVEGITPRKEATAFEETYCSSHARIASHTMTSPTGVTSPSSPTRTSLGTSSAPRYGITTGLVPKPPPLMPITGIRLMQEGSGAISTPLAVSVGGHVSTSISRSPNKVTSPPGPRARRSVSPDGPPPLISRSVISPTGSSQGTSPKGPPPLIRGIVSPVQPALRSPDSDADSAVKTKANQDVVLRRRRDQESCVPEGTSQQGESNIDQDFQRKFWMHLRETAPASSQRSESEDVTTSRRAGHSQISTIVATRTYLDSAEMRQPPRHHLEPFQPHTGVGAEECPPMPSSSSALVTETREATSVAETSQSWTLTENDVNMRARIQPEESRFVGGQSGEINEQVSESWQKNRKVYSFLPQNESSAEALVSHASGSETEDGDEGELDTEDDIPTVHSSSACLHPRVRALARSSQSLAQPSYYDASDSETLSAEESEVLPESSDEMCPSTTTKPYSQPENVCEGGRDIERESAVRDTDVTADTSVADPDDTRLGTSRDYSESEDEDIEGSLLEGEDNEQSDVLQDNVTSTGPVSVQLLDLKTKAVMDNSPTTSKFPEDSLHQGEKLDAEAAEEIGVSVGQEIGEETSEISDQDLVPSQSSPPCEPVVEEGSSEALPVPAYRSVYEEDARRARSSEDSLVGSSKTDLATGLPQVESSHQQVTEEIPDSSANFESVPDLSETSSSVKNFDDLDLNVPDEGDSVAVDDNTKRVQSLNEARGHHNIDVNDTVGGCERPRTSETENVVSPVQEEKDEGINEADSLGKPPAEHGFLREVDTLSSSSDSHPPEISSAMDDVSDDGEHLSYPTFIGEFVPLPGEVDSPDVRSGCSAHITSEESSICDENVSDKEAKNEYEPEPSNQEEPSGVLSPDGGARHTDDTLSEGEIPPSQESSQSEDEMASAGDKSASNEATPAVTKEPIEKPQSSWHSESSQQVADRDRLPSQSKETVEDDQLSEGEIRESDDEESVDTSQGSPVSKASAVSSSASGGDADSTRVLARQASVVSSSQEATLQTGCYINTVPISPAPPESPSHESEIDRASPLPPWPPMDSHYSSVASLSLAARITPFPYSTLSINVGSASSSARSSPVPQALTVNLAPGSSPSSSSLLSRPQEPTPLLSDNYEPLSDDDDDGLADTSNISDEQDHI